MEKEGKLEIQQIVKDHLLWYYASQQIRSASRALLFMHFPLPMKQVTTRDRSFSELVVLLWNVLSLEASTYFTFLCTRTKHTFLSRFLIKGFILSVFNGLLLF